MADSSRFRSFYAVWHSFNMTFTQGRFGALYVFVTFLATGFKKKIKNQKNALLQRLIASLLQVRQDFGYPTLLRNTEHDFQPERRVT